jgi:hypothetical protein
VTVLRRVTQPPHIAGPLAKMLAALLIGLAPYLDNFLITSIFTGILTENADAHQTLRQICLKLKHTGNMTDFVASQFL